jgi:two-component system, sensor histidine kinase and response regulator
VSRGPALRAASHAHDSADGGQVSEGAVPETVVVIDDDHAMRMSCRQILSKMGFRVEVFEDGSAGLEGVARLKPALVVVDLKMPGIGGLEVVARVHDVDPEIIIVVITGYATIGTAVDAMKNGAYDFLPKPFSPDELRVIVNRGLERRLLQRESRRHQVERELMRRRFVTFVSHQLKTPLAAIYQYLDVLRRMGDTADAAAKRAEWLDRCLVRTAEMQSLIHDWLTLAEVEGGTLARRRERVDVGSVLCMLVETYEQLLASAGVTLTCAVPAGRFEVLGDRNCLSVLFDNLIDNAIKYNRAGGTVHVAGRADAGEVIIEVADTGAGIRAEYRHLLFEEFYRLPAEEGRRPAGSGLGLPICKRIVSEHGGVIEVESQEHVGSTFRVRLPAATDVAPDARQVVPGART